MAPVCLMCDRYSPSGAQPSATVSLHFTGDRRGTKKPLGPKTAAVGTVDRMSAHSVCTSASHVSGITFVYVLVQQRRILSHEGSCAGENGREAKSGWLTGLLGDPFFLRLQLWQVSLLDPPPSA